MHRTPSSRGIEFSVEEWTSQNDMRVNGQPQHAKPPGQGVLPHWHVPPMPLSPEAFASSHFLSLVSASDCCPTLELRGGSHITPDL
jgi:hypothetical protein